MACFNTSTGFSSDHHGIFATLNSRLVKIPGHKYYFVPTGTQAGHRLKFRDYPSQTGTLGMDYDIGRYRKNNALASMLV